MDAEQVKSARLSLGLTKGRAAFVFGVDSRTWRRWETGQRDVSAPVVKLITLCTTVPAAWEALQAIAGPGEAEPAPEA